MSPAWLLRIGVALALAGALAWGARVDHLRAQWKSRFETVRDEAAQVVLALGAATGTRASWAAAPQQIAALGHSRRALHAAVELQNARINELAREAVRMRAEAAELRAIADRAEAQRRAARQRLNELSLAPGTRADCEQLLAEAEEALDLVREAGL